MNKTYSSWLLVISVLAAMNFFVACKDPNTTGAGVLDDQELIGVNFVDTFALEMRTIVVDSDLTGNLNLVQFGNYLDPEFGLIEAGGYIQFRIAGNDLSFGDTSTLSLDSVVLQLDVVGHYGDHTYPQTLRVHEITGKTLSDTVNYYSNEFIAYDGANDLANGKSIGFAGFNGPGTIAVRLDNSIGDKILFAPADSLASNDAFVSFFKGLHISTDQVPQNTREPGAIYFIDMTTTKTKLTLFYHADTVASQFSFIINNDAGRYHALKRSDFSNRLFGQTDHNLPRESNYFLEIGLLTQTAVYIPNITDIFPAGINRAELILKLNPAYLGTAERFTPPLVIYAFRADSSGKKAVTGIDYVSFGNYNTATNEYIIPLTNNLLQVIGGAIDNDGYILYPGLNGSLINRAVIGGPGDALYAPRLRIVYTTFPR